MTSDEPDLEAAYALQTPADSKRLYASWADSYDQDLTEGLKYLLPEITARCFVGVNGRGPVLDVGAGTGLCGQWLDRLNVQGIDATDISAEMLEQASRKDVYRDCIEADLTEGLPLPADSYSGIVSSGTFTHGHVGPSVLPELLRVARSGAWFALSVNAKHYDAKGFAAMFDHLVADKRICSLSLPEHRIYGEGAEGEHKDDTALIALFQKT